MTNKPPAKGRESKIIIPERCNPYARLVFAEMKRQGKTYDQMEWESGVLRCTLKAWRKDNRPGLETIEAALGALGWWFVPLPQEDKIPDHIREKVKALAEEWADFDEVLARVVIGMCRPETLMPNRQTVTIEDVCKEVEIKPRSRKSKEPHPTQVVLFGEAA